MSGIGFGLAERAWMGKQQCEILPGDVLIKHIFRTYDTTTRLIRLSAMMHVFDRKGSNTAEHVAAVVNVAGATRMMEAVKQGVVLQSLTAANPAFRGATGEDGMDILHRDNAYVVYRLTSGSAKDLNVRDMLWNGMATRLATIQGENPPAVALNRDAYDRSNDRKFKALYAAAAYAHNTGGSHGAQTDSLVMSLARRTAGSNSDGGQSTAYSVPVMGTHILPTLISDNLVLDSNDRKMVDFIGGERNEMTHICSGFVATLLQAWSVYSGHGRVFTDPASAHPTGTEHKLESGHLRGWTNVGTWGQAQGHGSTNASHVPGLRKAKPLGAR